MIRLENLGMCSLRTLGMLLGSQPLLTPSIHFETSAVKDRQRWFTLQMSIAGAAGQGQRQVPKTQSGSPTTCCLPEYISRDRS